MGKMDSTTTGKVVVVLVVVEGEVDLKRRTAKYKLEKSI